MKSNRKTTKSEIKDKTQVSPMKKAIKYIFSTFFYLPVCFIKVKTIKPDQPIDDLVKFVFNNFGSLIAPMQVREEITSLLNYIKKNRPKTILEIGTARGGTLFLFSKVAPKNAKIISLDLPGGKFGGGYPFWKIPLYKRFVLDTQRLHLVREDSQTEMTFNKIKGLLNGNKIDFLFVDGDHTYEGVKRDFELYSRLVRKGGTIVFHDIVPNQKQPECRVGDFWNEIKDKYDYKELVKDWDQRWCGIGLITL